jgi:hypothetical protein
VGLADISVPQGDATSAIGGTGAINPAPAPLASDLEDSSAPGPSSDPATPEWAATVDLFGFAPLRATNTTTVRGFGTPVDLSLWDILDVLNGYVPAAASIEKGRLGLASEVFMFNIKGQGAVTTGPNDGVRADTLVFLKQGVYDLALRYRFGARESAVGNPGQYTIIPYVGARLASVQFQVESDVSASRSGRREDRDGRRSRPGRDDRDVERDSRPDADSLTPAAPSRSPEVTRRRFRQGSSDRRRNRGDSRGTRAGAPSVTRRGPRSRRPGGSGRNRSSSSVRAITSSRLVSSGSERRAITVPDPRSSFTPRTRPFQDVEGSRLSGLSSVSGLTLRETIGRVWVQPLLGIKASYFLSPRLKAFVRADIGGLGLAGSEDLSGNAQIGLGYAIGNRTDLLVSWRYLGLAWANGGAGRNEYRYSTDLNGVECRVRFYF